MTKPISTVFGTGTPVRKRNVWKGPERLYPAIVGARKDPVRVRPALSPAGAFGLIAHNGVDTYVIAQGAGGAVSTSPDLLTSTSRTLGSTVSGIGHSLLHYKGSFFYSSHSSTPTSAVFRSADKGVTWVDSGSHDGALSVVGDTLYAVPQQYSSTGMTATFYTTTDPATASVARAFSRAGYFGKVVGSAARQYCFGRTNYSIAPWTLGEVSTNGVAFSQDVGFEALAARAPSGAKLNNAASLGNGGVLVFSCTSSGLYCLVADAAGNWSVGASLPHDIDGYRFYAPGISGTYAAPANTFTDADGITHVILIVQDAAGNYLARMASTYDGKSWQFLAPHCHFGTTAPTTGVGVFSRIDGTPIFNAQSGVLAEANMDAMELFYEL